MNILYNYMSYHRKVFNTDKIFNANFTHTRIREYQLRTFFYPPLYMLYVFSNVTKYEAKMKKHRKLDDV